MHDEDTQDRRRRRPVLLAMLVAAALLLALAGSGAIAGNGGSSPGSDESTGLTRDGSRQQGNGQGLTHRGRQCHHEGRKQAPQQDPTGSPPV